MCPPCAQNAVRGHHPPAPTLLRSAVQRSRAEYLPGHPEPVCRGPARTKLPHGNPPRRATAPGGTTRGRARCLEPGGECIQDSRRRIAGDDPIGAERLHDRSCAGRVDSPGRFEGLRSGMGRLVSSTGGPARRVHVSPFQPRGHVQVSPAHAARPIRREVQAPTIRGDMRIVLVERAVDHGPKVGRRGPGMEDRLTRRGPDVQASALPPWSRREEERLETVEPDRALRRRRLSQAEREISAPDASAAGSAAAADPCRSRCRSGF